MPQKKRNPKEIVAKLRPVDVLASQGRPVAEVRELAPALRRPAPALEPPPRAARHIVAGCPALNQGGKALHASDSIRATSEPDPK